MDEINERKLWIIEINFSKLSRISITYACRRHSNRSKWFMIYSCLPRQCRTTENNSTNLGICLRGRSRS